MRSLKLADSLFLGRVNENSLDEDQLVFSFSDNQNEDQSYLSELVKWARVDSIFPTLAENVCLGVYKSSLLLIRDESFRTHFGYFEMTFQKSRWVDVDGQEIGEPFEWMYDHTRPKKKITPISSTIN